MSRIRMWSLTSALLVLALVAGACGDSSDTSGTSASSKPLSAEKRADLDRQLKEIKAETATRFVGKVEGTDAFIGVENRASELTAYVCDSKNLAVWMTGKVSGNAFSAANGPVSMTGTLSGDGKQLTGSVALPDGSKHAFTADQAQPPAGLYEARAPAEKGIVRAGWVVLANGEQRGAAKTGDVVKPVDQVSDELRVKLGGESVPVIPAPGPVTDKASFCTSVTSLFHDMNNFLDKRIDEGASLEEIGSLVESLVEIFKALRDEGCDVSGLSI